MRRNSGRKPKLSKRSYRIIRSRCLENRSILHNTLFRIWIEVNMFPDTRFTAF